MCREASSNCASTELTHNKKRLYSEIKQLTLKTPLCTTTDRSRLTRLPILMLNYTYAKRRCSHTEPLNQHVLSLTSFILSSICAHTHRQQIAASFSFNTIIFYTYGFPSGPVSRSNHSVQNCFLCVCHKSR